MAIVSASQRLGMVGVLAFAVTFVIAGGCAQDAESSDSASGGAGSAPDLPGGSPDGGAGGTGATSPGTGSHGGSSVPPMDDGPAATIQTGATNKFLLKGTIVTPDSSFDGQLLVENSTLVCVKPGTECENKQAALGATVIDTNGVIAPGLIDTHNHILFDIFDDNHWVPSNATSCSTDSDCKNDTTNRYCRNNNKCACVDNVCKYTFHSQWTDEDEYSVMLDYKQCMENSSQGKPSWCPRTRFNSELKYNCELDKWGEIKGLIAGTTSIVGLPGTSGACFSSVARSIDVPQNGLGVDAIQTSVSIPSASAASAACGNFSSGSTKAYLIHCGEGTNAQALAEFNTLLGRLTNERCLAGTTITHGTSFTRAEYDQMYSKQMKLTWSPASNVALYGKTNNLPEAIAAGLTISIGPDWSMGGSSNMLEELRFAKKWSDNHFGGLLDAKQIVRMATVNGAAVLALSDVIGSLSEGLKADLFVVGGDRSTPYDAILAATPKTVRLVMVDGKVLYGDKHLEAAAPANPGCENMDVCERSKFLCVAESSSSNRLDQTMVQIRDTLNSAVQELDNVPVLPPASCGNSCTSTEECYERTVFEQVDASLCPSGSCPNGQVCYRAAQTGGNQYKCYTPNACEKKRTKKFFPITTLFKCQ